MCITHAKDVDLLGEYALDIRHQVRAEDAPVGEIDCLDAERERSGIPELMQQTSTNPLNPFSSSLHTNDTYIYIYKFSSTQTLASLNARCLGLLTTGLDNNITIIVELCYESLCILQARDHLLLQ